MKGKEKLETKQDEDGWDRVEVEKEEKSRGDDESRMKITRKTRNGMWWMEEQVRGMECECVRKIARWAMKGNGGAQEGGMGGGW